jgi:hypothetical protein
MPLYRVNRKIHQFGYGKIRVMGGSLIDVPADVAKKIPYILTLEQKELPPGETAQPEPKPQVTGEMPSSPVTPESQPILHSDSQNANAKFTLTEAVQPAADGFL